MSDRVKNEDGGTRTREGMGKSVWLKTRKKVLPRHCFINHFSCLQSRLGDSTRLNKFGIVQRMKHQYVLKFPKETRLLDTGRNGDPCTLYKACTYVSTFYNNEPPARTLSPAREDDV